MPYTNIIFINKKLHDSNIFIDSCNDSTLPILYSKNTLREEIIETLRTHFQNSIVQRLGLAFESSQTIFFNNESIFDSPNTQFLIDIIKEFQIKNIDFLACNTLLEDRWKELYGLLNNETGIIVGASNNRTGNISYGGDWVLESINTDIELIYFTKSIEYYKYLLDPMSSHSVIIRNNRIYACGNNSNGQLGNGTTTNSSIFIELTNNTGKIPISISTGVNHTMVLMKDLSTNELSIYGCGNNTYGQLGNETNTNSDVLSIMTNTTTSIPSSISCGDSHTMVLMTDNTIYGCGNNEYGQLGNETNTNSNVLSIMTNNTTSIPSSISCGNNHTTVLMTDKTVYSVGANESGQLGNGNLINSNVLLLISNTTGKTPSSIFCGYSTTTALMTDGTIYSVGNNSNGQFGDGSNNIIKNSFTQMINNTGKVPLSINVNNSYIIISMTDGSIYGCGKNDSGQLGNGTITDSNIITDVIYLNIDSQSFIFSISNIDLNNNLLIPIVNSGYSFNGLKNKKTINGNTTTVTVSYNYYTNNNSNDGLSFNTNVVPYGKSSSINIQNFGEFVLPNMTSTSNASFYNFYGIITATDVPKIINTGLAYCFYNSKCNNFGNISNWNVSNVINMNNMFKNAINFKETSIGNWIFSSISTITDFIANTAYSLSECFTFLTNLSNNNSISNKYFGIIPNIRTSDYATLSSSFTSKSITFSNIKLYDLILSKSYLTSYDFSINYDSNVVFNGLLIVDSFNNISILEDKYNKFNNMLIFDYLNSADYLIDLSNNKFSIGGTNISRISYFNTIFPSAIEYNLSGNKLSYYDNNNWTTIETAIISDLSNINITLEYFNRYKKTAYELKNLGYILTELKTAGYGASELKSINYTATELINVNFSINELKFAGYSAGDLKDLFSLDLLKGVGYIPIELKNVGFTASDLKNVGFTASDLKDIFLLNELKDATYSVNELKDATYSINELKDVGFTAKELKDGGFLLNDFEESDFSVIELRVAGFSGLELKSLGFSASIMKLAGFSLIEMKNIGYTKIELISAKYNFFEICKLFKEVETTKKWIGGNRDSSDRIRNNRLCVINTEKSTPNNQYVESSTNTVREAMKRVRNSGSSVPAKVIHKYTNAPVFY